MVTGRTFDVGAGSGYRAFVLQRADKEVSAINMSPLSVEVIKLQGVKDARQINLSGERSTDTFDTIPMLTDGSGTVGYLENMLAFFRKMKQLLRPDGCILMDLSNLHYLLEDEDESFPIDLAGDHYGEIDLRM